MDFLEPFYFSITVQKHKVWEFIFIIGSPVRNMSTITLSGFDKRTFSLLQLISCIQLNIKSCVIMYGVKRAKFIMLNTCIHDKRKFIFWENEYEIDFIS